ncbi:hypothetical protein Ancab_034751 [Ancistrocladus abbreviatus]
MAVMLQALTALALIFLLTWLLRISYETISFYWLNPKRIKKFMEKQGVRGPYPRPLIGNLLDMASLIASSTSLEMPSIHHDLVSRLLPHFVLWSKQYGKRFIYWNGFEPRMCLTDMNMIKEFLSKYSYSSGKSWLQQQGSKNFIGGGVLMANGEDWHRQRHLVAPAFTGDKLKSYAGHTVESTKKMLQSLQSDFVYGKKEVEIGGIMTGLTADIISRVEFGACFEKGKSIFQRLTDLQLLCAQASRHLCLPGSRFFPSKYNKDIKALKIEVEGMLMEIIESRKAIVEIGQSDSYGNDLLGILLNEMMKNKSKKGSGDHGSLNMQLIMDECKTFFFAGHETTALLLTWTVMLLASNPFWQDKVREEVAQVCNGATPSVDHLPKLSLQSIKVQFHVII